MDNNGLLAAGHNKVLVPSAYNYYFAWGLPDHSLILGNVEGKTLQVNLATVEQCRDITGKVTVATVAMFPAFEGGNFRESRLLEGVFLNA